ncbi:DUF7638 domain-containing protein [Streptomyces sp. NPDC004838]
MDGVIGNRIACREADGVRISGTRRHVFIRHGGTFFLTGLAVYADGLIDRRVRSSFTVEEFGQKPRSGQGPPTSRKAPRHRPTPGLMEASVTRHRRPVERSTRLDGPVPGRRPQHDVRVDRKPVQLAAAPQQSRSSPPPPTTRPPSRPDHHTDGVR